MLSSFNHKNIALSVTLGLFTFHLYVVSHYDVVERQNSNSQETRTPASQSEAPTCIRVSNKSDFDDKEYEDGDEVICYFHSSTSESDVRSIDIMYKGQTGSTSYVLNDEELEERSIDELDAVALGGLLQIIAPEDFPEQEQVAEEDVEEEESPVEPENRVVVEEVPEEREEEPIAEMTLDERIEKASESVNSFASDEACSFDIEKVSEAEKLLSRIEGYSSETLKERRIGQLEDLVTAIEDGEGEEQSELAILECHVARANSTDNQAEQFALYQREVLPRLRQKFAATGSIDGGVEGLESLQSNNQTIATSIDIENKVASRARHFLQTHSQIETLNQQIAAAPNHPQAQAARQKVETLKGQLKNQWDGLENISHEYDLGLSGMVNESRNFWTNGFESSEIIAEMNVGGNSELGTEEILGDNGAAQNPNGPAVSHMNNGGGSQGEGMTSVTNSQIDSTIQALRSRAQAMTNEINKQNERARRGVERGNRQRNQEGRRDNPALDSWGQRVQQNSRAIQSIKTI